MEQLIGGEAGSCQPIPHPPNRRCTFAGVRLNGHPRFALAAPVQASARLTAEASGPLAPNIPGARILVMATREQLHQEFDALPATALANAQVVVKESASAENASGLPSQSAHPTKVGRLPFFGIGEGGPPDVSERLDEYLGRAIDARHPRS